MKFASSLSEVFMSAESVSNLAGCFSLSVWASSFFRAATLFTSDCSFSMESLVIPVDPPDEFSARCSAKERARVTSLDAMLPSGRLSFIRTLVRPLAGSER